MLLHLRISVPFGTQTDQTKVWVQPEENFAPQTEDAAGIQPGGERLRFTVLMWPSAENCPPVPLGQATLELSSQFSASAGQGLRQTHTSFCFILQADFVLTTSAFVCVVSNSVLLCLTTDHFSYFLTAETPGVKGEVDGWVWDIWKQAQQCMLVA